MFISNRFLNLVHILCVPKPTSVDLYVREERARFFIFIVAKMDRKMQSRTRTAYVWSRESYNELMSGKRDNTKLFNNPKKLLKYCPPDFAVELPDFLDGTRIPLEMFKEYKARKAVYNLKQSLDMQSSLDHEEKKKQKVDYSVLRVQPGEDCWSWSKRTGRSPSSFDLWRRKSGL
jgi:hypothetical protein